MLRIRPAVDLASLGLDWLPCLETARRLGVEAVEIDLRRQLPWRELGQTAVREIRKQLSDRNLRLSVVRFRTKRGYDDAQDVERRVEGTKTAMRLAAALGACFVTNRLGRLPQEAEDASPDSAGQTPLIVDVLTDLIRYSEREGVMLTGELGEDSGEELARLLKMLPGEGVGLDLDPGLLAAFGHSPQQALQAVGTSVTVVHATDAVLGGGSGGRRIAPLGTGDVDYAEVLGSLEKVGYQGDFFVRAVGDEQPAAEVRQAIDYLRRM
ncbi:MAG: sugar phosphate isomerase/epimerase [Thermogutta sp.]|nr:sugar phosphate isomerase/epimerase [Thermogutta sp.]